MRGQRPQLARRDLLKLGALGLGGLLLPLGAQGSLLLAGEGLSALEKFPTSPLILEPFRDPLPIPRALAPLSDVTALSTPPGPGPGQQDSEGKTRHQIWTSGLGLPAPVIYRIRVDVGSHSFTTSKVLPIDSKGRPTDSFDERRGIHPAGTPRTLPPSTIYGFNGGSGPTFPGPRINAEYGKPALVRFENHLDENPRNLDRVDFGSPEWGFLTHLHNGHTAPESDGNPFHKDHGFLPGQWVDNLYLNYPAGGDEREKQTFLWFHDHFHGHTGANVYKGLVGLYPIYDPILDPGDERLGLHLPGRRTNNPDGSFDVEYDIPMAIYDCALDDGVTPHQDFHNGRGEVHPEWWGKTFFRHMPNHGFVGDLFTVNGVAFPVLEVKRRKYRLRFLDASIARIYQLRLMSSTRGPRTAASLGFSGEDLQGQYRLPDGQQCMKWVQIASGGGFLPAPVTRESVELWPAGRKEFIVDFTRYMDGSPTSKGDVIYLVNTQKMRDGRKPDSPDSKYKVPILKIVIGDDAEDDSVIPRTLRELPALPPPAELRRLIEKRRVFRMERSGKAGGEDEWLINGLPFLEDRPLVTVKRDAGEVWEFENGGGGWVHPMHIHQEEHRILLRDGNPVPTPRHPDDGSKEDMVELDPGESVLFFRRFRTFTGKYVAHCHNLAHEDHSMMFGWEIVP